MTASVYGADPTGATDSSNPVLLAHIAAKNAGGGVVLFPVGVFLVITANGIGLAGQNVTWRGLGMWISILRMSITSGSNAPLVVVNTPPANPATGNLTFEDLQFDWQQGVGGDTRTGSCAALNLSSSKNFMVRRCRFIRRAAVSR